MLTLAIVATPAVARAQNLEPRSLPDGAAEMITEMTTIQNRLAPMQERAMQHPSLQAEGERLGESIRGAMAKITPEAPGLIAQLDEMGLEAEAAQLAGDADKVRELVMEAREIEELLIVTQEAATQLPEITAAIEDFEAKVQSRMRDDNPEAGPLLERLATLNAQLAILLQLP
jgi:hypothetical protein